MISPNALRSASDPRGPDRQSKLDIRGDLEQLDHERKQCITARSTQDPVRPTKQLSAKHVIFGCRSGRGSCTTAGDDPSRKLASWPARKRALSSAAVASSACLSTAMPHTRQAVGVKRGGWTKDRAAQEAPESDQQRHHAYDPAAPSLTTASVARAEQTELTLARQRSSIAGARVDHDDAVMALALDSDVMRAAVPTRAASRLDGVAATRR
eukprot:3897845-Rhodomonas_salina.4